MLAKRENILLYSLESKELLTRYEGHAESICTLEFAHTGNSFISTAENEGFANVWQTEAQEATVASPFKMLEIGGKKTASQASLFHLESDYFCAVCVTQAACSIFLLNLKKKKGKLVQKPDTEIRLNSRRKA